MSGTPSRAGLGAENPALGIAHLQESGTDFALEMGMQAQRTDKEAGC